MLATVEYIAYSKSAVFNPTFKDVKEYVFPRRFSRAPWKTAKVVVLNIKEALDSAWPVANDWCHSKWQFCLKALIGVPSALAVSYPHDKRVTSQNDPSENDK